MKKLESFGRIEKIGEMGKVVTDNILETSLYLILNCYIYSYHINEESIEYVIAGDDIESKRWKISGRSQKIKVKSLIETFNYLIEFESSLLNKTQGGKE